MEPQLHRTTSVALAICFLLTFSYLFPKLNSQCTHDHHGHDHHAHFEDSDAPATSSWDSDHEHHDHHHHHHHHQEIHHDHDLHHDHSHGHHHDFSTSPIDAHQAEPEHEGEGDSDSEEICTQCKHKHSYRDIKQSRGGKDTSSFLLAEELAEEKELEEEMNSKDFDHEDLSHEYTNKLDLWAQALGSSLLVSLASLICLSVLPFISGKVPMKAVVDILSAFGVGAMLGDTFFHQLPHAFGGSAHSHSGHDHGGTSTHEGHHHHDHHHHHPSPPPPLHSNSGKESHSIGHSHSIQDLSIGMAILFGILLFFVIEKIVTKVEELNKKYRVHSSHHHHHHHKKSDHSEPDISGLMLEDNPSDKKKKNKRVEECKGNEETKSLESPDTHTDKKDSKLPKVKEVMEQRDIKNEIDKTEKGKGKEKVKHKENLVKEIKDEKVEENVSGGIVEQEKVSDVKEVQSDECDVKKNHTVDEAVSDEGEGWEFVKSARQKSKVHKGATESNEDKAGSREGREIKEEGGFRGDTSFDLLEDEIEESVRTHEAESEEVNSSEIKQEIAEKKKSKEKTKLRQRKKGVNSKGKNSEDKLEGVEDTTLTTGDDKGVDGRGGGEGDDVPTNESSKSPPTTATAQGTSTDKAKDSSATSINKSVINQSNASKSHSVDDVNSPHKIEASLAVIGYLNLFSDGIHNFTDGLSLGSAFVNYGSVVGYYRMLFMLAHEIPQEIGDFGILVRSGMSSGKALLLNFFSALMAVLGTVIALSFGASNVNSSLIEGFTAGGFIYISLAGVVPNLHSPNQSILSSALQFSSILLGILIALIISLME